MVDLIYCKHIVSLRSLIFFLFFTPTDLPRWSPIQVLTRPDSASEIRWDWACSWWHGLRVSVIHPMSMNKCKLTYTHHYKTIQSILTALKILCALPVFLSTPTPLPATTDFFLLVFFVFIVLPFLECHIVVIIQYVAIPVGFFHLVICV